MITAKTAKEVSDTVRARQEADRVRKETIASLTSLFQHIEKEMNEGSKSLLIDNLRERDKGEVYFDLDQLQREFLKGLGYWFDRGENYDNDEIGHGDFDEEFICWP